VTAPPLDEDERAELQRLRQRVGELEDELHEQARRVNEIVGAAQVKTYWLDRWHVDLNTWMTSPYGRGVRGLARIVRVPVRLLRRMKRAVRK
jgi:hypothetical protein